MLRNSLRLGANVVSLWPFLPIAARVSMYGRLVVDLVGDPRVPWSRKAVLGIAAAYVASPVDLVPDWIPFVSRIDDVVVTLVAMDLFLDGIPREVLLERMYAQGIDGRELERDLEALRRFLPPPVREAVRRLPSLLETGAAFVQRELAERGIIGTGNHKEAGFE
jgi:uncharacterized membrane protein YkvA (DUF1232 family)